MAAFHGDWRAPQRQSFAKSGSVYDTPEYGSWRPSLGGNGNYERPTPNLGEKKHSDDDSGSIISKFSCLSYASASTNRQCGRRIRTTSRIASIPQEDFFKPGSIIAADHFEEVLEHYSTGGQETKIIRVPGQKDICEKKRLFIVLAQHAQTYVSIPIYSHNGAGTKHKPDPDEYVSVRDHRAVVQAPPQSIHDPVTTLDMSGPELTATSVAHLVYPVSRPYVLPVKVIGRLAVSCTHHLIRLFRKNMAMEVRDTPRSSSTQFSIHAGVTITDAFQVLRLKEYALPFHNVSWSTAARLSDSDLKAKGITLGKTRQKLCSLFREVDKASDSGPDWQVMIEEDS